MDTPRSMQSPSYATANGSTTKPTPTSAGSTRRPDAIEVNKLRSDLRSKLAEINDLSKEIRTLQNIISAKDAAIEDAEQKRSLSEERAMELQDEAARLKSSAAKWQQERKKLESDLKAANDEADRLNNLRNSSSDHSQQSNSESLVKLHNQLAEARKEIKRLKDDNKGTHNILAAKDKALEELQAQLTDAKEASEARRDDQNKILDLRRQLAQARGKLGGTERISQLAEMESDELRDALLVKEAELEEHLELITELRTEVAEAQAAQSMAERAAAEAKADMLSAKALVDQAKSAEKIRMEGGGYVSRSMYMEETKAMQESIDSLQERLIALSADAENGDGIRSAAARLELEAARKHACARVAREKADHAKTKAKLAEAIGEFQYSLQFHEAPPTAEEIARYESEAKEAGAQAADTVSALVTERDAAVRATNQVEMSLQKLQKEQAILQKACELSQEAEKVAQKESEQMLATLTAVELALAAKNKECEALEKKVEDTEQQARNAAAVAKEEVTLVQRKLVKSEQELQEIQQQQLQGAQRAKDEVHELNSQLDQSKQAFEAQLNTLQRQLDEKEAAVQELNKNIVEKEQCIHRVEQEVVEKIEALSRIEKVLVEKDAKIEETAQELQSAILSKEDSIEITAARIAALQEELVVVKQNLSKTQQELLDANEERKNRKKEVEHMNAELIKSYEYSQQLAEDIETRSIAAAMTAAATARAVQAADQLQQSEPASMHPVTTPHRPAADGVDPAGYGQSGDDYLQDLLTSRMEIAELKGENDELRSQVAALTPHRGQIPAFAADIDDDLSDGSEELPARRFVPGGGPVAGDAVVGMTPAALKSVIERLVEARQNQGMVDEEEVYNEAIALLQGELSRLAKEMTEQAKEAARLRSEVGALHTATLSAQQTADMLNEQNHLSMKIVSLTTYNEELQNEYARCEESFLREIASLKAELKQAKQNDPLKKMRKAVSSTAKGGTRVVTSAVRGLGKSLDSVVQNMNARNDMAVAAGKATVAENASNSGPTTSPLLAGLTKRFSSTPGTTPSKPMQPAEPYT